MGIRYFAFDEGPRKWEEIREGRGVGAQERATLLAMRARMRGSSASQDRRAHRGVPAHNKKGRKRNKIEFYFDCTRRRCSMRSHARARDFIATRAARHAPGKQRQHLPVGDDDEDGLRSVRDVNTICTVPMRPQLAGSVASCAIRAPPAATVFSLTYTA